MSSARVIVFIDNSNIFKYLEDLKKIDIRWVKSYDPIELATKLAGARDLVSVYFYATPPPASLLKQDQTNGTNKYWIQMAYYEAIKKLPLIELRYGTLKGSGATLTEKNLDTQLTADMIRLAVENQYDTAILVSNDGDYQSAVETTKGFGKKIEVAYFKDRLSLNLKRACDLTRRMRQSYFRPLIFSLPKMV
jgi:uncharacterized LabA/DUF88 family protein